MSFIFFHYSWFTVFHQFSAVPQGSYIKFKISLPKFHENTSWDLKSLIVLNPLVKFRKFDIFMKYIAYLSFSIGFL